MKKKLIMLSSSVLSFMPLVVLAQTQITPGSTTGTCANASLNTVQYIICQIGDILDLAIPILIILGILYFIWGVITYVIASEEEAKKTGRNRMVYGIIGLVVITALWGLVGIVTNTFGLQGTASVPVPYVPF